MVVVVSDGVEDEEAFVISSVVVASVRSVVAPIAGVLLSIFMAVGTGPVMVSVLIL